MTHDIDDLTRQVWENVLGQSVELAALNGTCPNVTSSVQIMGAWTGTVSLRMTTELATVIAGSMFEMEADELGQEEIDDAVGEMANMIGGNVKSLLPGPSQLSMPTVSGGEEPPHFPGTVLGEHLEYEVAGQPFTVSVLAAAGVEGPNNHNNAEEQS